MATRNIQMNILTDSGSYDTLYPQTTASQAGARPNTWMPIASDVGALPISGGTLTGDLKIKNGGNYGTMLSLGDGDYVHFYEKTDDCLEIKAKMVNFLLSDTSDSKFTVNGSNPFGANGDSTKVIYETGTRIGTGTQAWDISLNKITTVINFFYKTEGANTAFHTISLNSANEKEGGMYYYEQGGQIGFSAGFLSTRNYNTNNSQSAFCYCEGSERKSSSIEIYYYSNKIYLKNMLTINYPGNKTGTTYYYMVIGF